MSTSHASKITEMEVKKVAQLARLRIDAKEIHEHALSLSNIFDLIAQINAQDTSGVTPMASPFMEAALQLREDKVTETNQREVLLKLAPLTESGLYLVPQVIE
ncbi:MAG TPA: Asp-tRNA(Asn)/Glu-tRNA(Gln) amidotransferase subunit GatC [Gammaproteobacteria bacterium]|nr:Asp-tRNA(Asn)/Glu-tRNA(Gln) amidotransferase subunit GatC [Gammaproteobacteria bacterium]